MFTVPSVRNCKFIAALKQCGTKLYRNLVQGMQDCYRNVMMQFLRSFLLGFYEITTVIE